MGYRVYSWVQWRSCRYTRRRSSSSNPYASSTHAHARGRHFYTSSADTGAPHRHFYAGSAHADTGPTATHHPTNASTTTYRSHLRAK
jgi:hypothetical protein